VSHTKTISFFNRRQKQATSRIAQNTQRWVWNRHYFWNFSVGVLQLGGRYGFRYESWLEGQAQMGWFCDSRQDPWIDQFFHFQPSNDVGRTGSWLPLKMVDITEQSIAKAGMSDVK
jgi:hypothetical protein